MGRAGLDDLDKDLVGTNHTQVVARMFLDCDPALAQVADFGLQPGIALGEAIVGEALRDDLPVGFPDPEGGARRQFPRWRARSSSCSRSTRRCTLPVVVIGSAAMNSISLGYS